MESNNNQSFTVEHIRKIRDDDDKRRRNMNASELSEDVRKSAEEGRRIMEQLRNSHPIPQVV